MRLALIIGARPKESKVLSKTLLYPGKWRIVTKGFIDSVVSLLLQSSNKTCLIGVENMTSPLILDIKETTLVHAVMHKSGEEKYIYVYADRKKSDNP